MKPSRPSVDRRTLLIGGGVGIGLIVAFSLWPRSSAGPLRTGEGEHDFGSFLKIARDGRVTVAIPQTETGQGAWTALPQIVAEELGAAWEMVAVEPAPLGADYSNPLAVSQGWFDGFGIVRRLRLGDATMRITAGSTSVRGFEQPLRRAGAAARSLLAAAAAQRWGVRADQCETAGGFITCGAERASFGELAELAAAMDLPSDPPLRSLGSPQMGQPVPRLDLPPKSDGSFRFAADVRLPDMLFASARLAPHGGRIAGHSEEAASRIGGVRAVLASDGWVAAVADTWWAAERAMASADVRVSAPERADAAALTLLLEDALENREAENWLTHGDYGSAVSGSRPLTARYSVAAAPHLGLEPLTATARFTGGRLEVWAPTQAPEFARRAAADAGGTSDVFLYPMPVGDQAGRALEADAVPIAAELARRIGRPVQLTLSPSASQNHDRPAPAALARISALPNPSGTISAWRMRLATADGLGSSIARLARADAPDGLGATAMAGAVPPYGIPNVRIDAVPVLMPFQAGYMRGEPQRTLTFFMESFIDELARIAGADPLAYRMAMLGGNPRLARCLSEAASRGGWDGGDRGSSLGLAVASAFGSHIALLAEARIGDGQRIEVDRLVAVVDCGRPVNSGLIAQQIEGGLIWGLGLATPPEPEFGAGVPLAAPLGTLELPRLADTPEIDVHLVRSDAAPGGINGLGPTVIAPAVANAIAAGTGKRLRRLPLDPMAAA